MMFGEDIGERRKAKEARGVKSELGSNAHETQTEQRALCFQGADQARDITRHSSGRPIACRW